MIAGSQDFFRATKALHNALQGASQSLSAAERSAYLQSTSENATTLDGGYDFIVIHDPSRGTGKCRNARRITRGRASSLAPVAHWLVLPRGARAPTSAT